MSRALRRRLRQILRAMYEPTSSSCCEAEEPSGLRAVGAGQGAGGPSLPSPAGGLSGIVGEGTSALVEGVPEVRLQLLFYIVAVASFCH